ncbi:hypothetical protein PG999_006660 [Apiospora kogelbergensis]|uniref:Concanavalin a-like lectins glucanase n=1 Tax=Apiospora kogelbergensis TaxID=1337665 RepID=A0AAW0QW35_9PEZI
MGVSLSAARYLAPLAFLVDLAAQLYGLLSRPNMKDVHDAHISFFSPLPLFVACFFLPQQIFQAAWLWRLWRANPEDVEEDRAVRQMVDYVPYYAAGNLCIAAAWMAFWNQSDLKTANDFVIINSCLQLYYVFARLGPMNLGSRTSILTHVVSKMFAGIGVLDLLHNSSAAYAVGQAPNTAIKVLTGIGFGVFASCSDWIFGGCLAYDLVALMIGQRVYGNVVWSNLLGAFVSAVAGLVVVRNTLRPPYVRRVDYQALQ